MKKQCSSSRAQRGICFLVHPRQHLGTGAFSRDALRPLENVAPASGRQSRRRPRRREHWGAGEAARTTAGGTPALRCEAFSLNSGLRRCPSPTRDDKSGVVFPDTLQAPTGACDSSPVSGWRSEVVPSFSLSSPFVAAGAGHSRPRATDTNWPLSDKDTIAPRAGAVAVW